MTVIIDLPPELEKELQERAARAGQDMSSFILQAVKEKIAKPPTFDEICAPFAQAVEASGMTDEELEKFFEEIRDEVWQEKQAERGKRP
jgi:predicted transcriptional regulator